MTIIVCPLSLVRDQIKAHKPARVVSLLDPYTAFPETNYADLHLRVTIHDIVGDAEGFVAPQSAHVETLLSFVQGWDRADPILIHCYAGISRSTASAFITACVHNPRADEMEIAHALRTASSTARPNGRLIELADAVLGRSGRMVRAIQETGRELPWQEDVIAVPFSIPSVYAAVG